jgi:hypothetical protein
MNKKRDWNVSIAWGNNSINTIVRDMTALEMRSYIFQSAEKLLGPESCWMAGPSPDNIKVDSFTGIIRENFESATDVVSYMVCPLIRESGLSDCIQQ